MDDGAVAALVILGVGGVIFFCAQLNCYVERVRNRGRGNG